MWQQGTSRRLSTAIVRILTAEEVQKKKKVVATGHIPPTLNCDEPDVDEGCDLDYTPHKSVKLDRVRAAITDNLGFGGHNAALVFRAYDKTPK